VGSQRGSLLDTHDGWYSYRALQFFSGPNLQGNVVSAPRGRGRVQFFEEIGDIWTVGEVLVCVLRATTKKRSSTFWRKKSAPPDKILAVPMLDLPHRWQCFEKNWKHIYFSSHIWTLLCSLFVIVLAMVVLAVIYFGQLKNCHQMLM